MKFPRNYISFSQITSYEGGSFYDRYVLEKPSFENKYIRFGKHFANAMEGKFCPPEIEKLAKVFKLTLKDGIPEKKGTAVYNYKGVDYNLLGYIDWLSDDVDEFKTGKIPWTQKKADSHGQVLFYQLIMELKTGKKLDGYYHWIQTVEIDGNISGTGHFEKYKVPYDKVKIHLIKKRLERYIDFVIDYKPPKNIKL